MSVTQTGGVSSIRGNSVRGRLLLLGLLIIPAILLSWFGIHQIGTAEPAHPVFTSGRLVRYDLAPWEWRGWNFVGNGSLSDGHDVSLTSGTGPYRLHTREFHPAIPDLSARTGAEVNMWYDRGTRDLIALGIDNQIHTMDYFNHPRSKYWDGVTRGLILGAPGFLILIGLAVWAFRSTRAPVYSPPATEPAVGRRLFEYPYPTSPITLSRPASAIVADFKQAVVETGPLKARPQSTLREKREEIVEALFDEVKKKRGVIADDELVNLKTSLRELQTFVPDADVAVVARYQEAERIHAIESLPLEDYKRAGAVLARIQAGQHGVANFDYEKAEVLQQGATFMIAETLKWSDPAGAAEALDKGCIEAYGYLVYAVFGITSLVLFFARSVRWGSMQFWGLWVASLLGAICATMLAQTARSQLDQMKPTRAYALMVVLLPLGAPIFCLVVLEFLNAVAYRF